MRSFSGDYPLAFMTSGLACLSASLLALRIKRLAPVIVPTGLTGKERAISRLVAPGSRVTSEPDPTTVSRSAPFIRSELCVCRRARGWDLEFESGLLLQGVLVRTV